jgi:MFS family permease
MFSRAMVFPYAPLFILSLGGAPQEIGLVYALGPIGGLFVLPIAGYLADRTSRARLIAFTGFFSSSTFLLYIFARSWHWVAAGRLLQGFAVLQFPASSAIVADSLSPENRGRGMATMMSISGSVAIVAPYVAGVLLDAYGIDVGMRILYGIMAAAYASGATINLLFIRETTQPKPESIGVARLAAILKDAYTGLPAMLGRLPRSFKALAIIIIIGFMANGVASPFWVVYAREHIGLSSTQWGLVLLIEAALSNFIRVPSGFLSDRYGRTPFIFAALLMACGFIPLFVFAESLAHVMAIRCLVAVVSSTFGPSCGALIADAIPRDVRGRVMAAIGRGSVMIGASSGGTGGPGVGYLTIIPLMVASLAGGLFYAWNAVSPWVFVLLAYAVALVLTGVFVRDTEKAEV